MSDVNEHDSSSDGENGAAAPSLASLTHQMGLLYHDLQVLHNSMRKLRMTRRNQARYDEFVEQGLKLMQAATVLESNIRAHADFATSEYRTKSFLPKVENE